MIFTDRTIIVQKGTSSINDTIILYRGDKGVEIRFTLNEGSPFKFGSGASPNIIEKTEAAYGQLIIKRPNDLPAVFSEIAPTNKGKIVFTITAEMIDEITEVGNYTFQIRLLDESRNSRATLPEVANGIEIREPIATEDVTTTNEVGVATVGYALTTAGTSEDAFDTQGNYNKTTWGTGDRITASKLNKMEAGIDGVNKKVASGGTGGSNINDTTASATTTYSSNKIESIKEGLSSQIKEIPNRTIVEDGKLYLVKSDGTKIDSGTTLPIGGTSTGDNPSSDTYDTEISLPFTATSDTDVELTFSPSEVKSYSCEINSIDVSKWTDDTYSGSNHSIENVQEDGINCLKCTFGNESGYHIAKIVGTNNLDYTHKYLFYVKAKLGSKIAETDKPSFIVGLTTYDETWNGKNVSSINTDPDIQFNKTNTTDFQEIMCIGSPPNYNTNTVNARIFNDGVVYIAKMYFIDLTLNELETKTWDELKTMCQDGSFDNNSGTAIFSATIVNGLENTNIDAFETGEKIQYITVQNGNTLSIAKNGDYYLANVVAKVKSNTSSEIEIEDYQYILNTRFRGKTVVFEGDSITDSDYHVGYNGKSWADYLAIKLALGNTVNQSLGGSSISTYNASGSVVNRITSTNYPSDTKLFCIMAGTNDWNSNVALGDIDSTDTSTILGALNTIIDHLQTNYPDATIVIMTPMHRSGMRTATRAAGTLSDVAKAYEEVCMNWGVNCINTLKEFGMNAYNTTVANKFYVEQDSDWLHPNPAGHKRIAVRMAGYISTL